MKINLIFNLRMLNLGGNIIRLNEILWNEIYTKLIY